MFYLACTALYAVALYVNFNNEYNQPIISAALGFGFGWFLTKAISNA